MKSYKFNPFKGKGKYRGRLPTFIKASDRKIAFTMYYNDNKNFKDIGETYNTSMVTVKNLFKKMDWPARDRRSCQMTDGRWSPEAVDRYISRYLKGFSIDSIATSNKIAAFTLSDILKERGLLRTKKQSIAMRLDKIKSQANHRAVIKMKDSPYKDVCSFKSFREAVDSTTLICCNLIKAPTKLYTKFGDIAYHLDHKYSIHDAFYLPSIDCVTILELAHPVNLQYLPKMENIQKKHKSSITLDQLRASIFKYNKIYGNPYKNRIFRCPLKQESLKSYNRIYIEKFGGEYSETISRKTTILVSDSSSKKTEQAKKNGTKIMTRSKFAETLELAVIAEQTA